MDQPDAQAAETTRTPLFLHLRIRQTLATANVVQHGSPRSLIIGGPPPLRPASVDQWVEATAWQAVAFECM